MKRITLIICLVFCCFNLFAQRGFPKSAKEDKEKIMSEAYWNIWNPKVQAKIDKDIEQNRKANAIVGLQNVAAGSEVKIEQVSHDFVFGAHIFNYNQLGTPACNQKYKDVFGTLFNRATVAFYCNRIVLVFVKNTGIRKNIGIARQTRSINRTGVVLLPIRL